MDTDLNEINTEIHLLQTLRENLLKEDKEKRDDHIRSLKWTEDCDAMLYVSDLGGRGTGLPTYKIIVYGKSVPKLLGLESVNILGDSRHYEDNITFSRDSQFEGMAHCFYTCSETALIELMSKAKFNKIEYNKKHWDVLDAVRRIYADKAKGR